MNLEGDALGSELATYILLKKIRKKVIICNNDPTPQIYKFLPFSGVIKNSLDKSDFFDVAIVLDCSDASRTGKIKDYLSRVKCIINIDHHISNTFFGDINWVEPDKSSTCEMLYKLCEKFKMIDGKIALCLYTGIFTDTGNFTYANTTYSTHKIIANLMKYGIRSNKIYQALHSLCEPYDLKFIGKIISSLKFDARKKICWATIKQWKEKEYDLTEVIFSVMRLLKDVEVFLLFKKIGKNKIRVNFRSRSSIDVNKIAQFFGGGGHKMASGTTVEDALEEAEKKIISFIKRYTNNIKSKKRNNLNYGKK
jgi:phosphoesterase RecJ-like protein